MLCVNYQVKDLAVIFVSVFTFSYNLNLNQHGRVILDDDNFIFNQRTKTKKVSKHYGSSLQQ